MSSNFEKAKAKHQALMNERKRRKENIGRGLEDLYEDIAESDRLHRNNKQAHTASIDNLHGATLSLIRMLKESLK